MYYGGRILYSDKLDAFSGKPQTINTHYMTDEELDFFNKNGCGIIKSQWVDFNEIEKVLPFPFCSLSIRMSKDKYEFIGELNYLSDVIPTVHGIINSLVSAVELHGDNLIQLYKDLMKLAKEKTKEYHEYVIKTKFEGV